MIDCDGIISTIDASSIVQLYMQFSGVVYYMAHVWKLIQMSYLQIIKLHWTLQADEKVFKRRRNTENEFWF